MDDYENDGRDYNENIDEGPTDIEIEGFFSRKVDSPDTNKSEPDKNSTESKKCKSCECKDGKPQKKGSRKREKNGKSEKHEKSETNGKSEKSEKNGKSEKRRKNGKKNGKNGKSGKNGDENGTDDSTGKSKERKQLTVQKQSRKGRKKKEKRMSNPFIIFYLEQLNKSPNRKCVAEIAMEAGNAWGKMSPKEKEKYIIKAKQARIRRQQSVITEKTKRGRGSKGSKISRDKSKEC